MAKRLQIDWLLFTAAATLALFGVVMVYSASAMLSLKETNGANQYLYAVKQGIFTILGLGLMLAATRFDYRWLRQSWFVYSVVSLAIVLLAAVFAFPPTNGARRWIKFAGMSFQPSEFAKLAVALFLAFFFSKGNDDGNGGYFRCGLFCGGRGLAAFRHCRRDFRPRSFGRAGFGSVANETPIRLY
jgi:cell division protein FtsW (lipid II flippase)